MLLLFSLLFSALCSTEDSASDLLIHKNNSFEEVDLASFIISKNIQHDVIFKEAVQLLESMRSSPSCNRIAASRLVTSCQSVREKTHNVDSETYRVLEHTRSLYAARLAICELEGAGTHIPNACLPVTIPPPQKKGIFGFSIKSGSPVNGVDPIPVQLLESCLKSLESRPQWWTSYSNSRQNAFVICQAARIENEKEELLDLHRSLVQGSNKLNQGLQEALRAAAAEFSQHRAFANEVANMNARLVHDMEETRSHFKTMIEKVFYKIEARAVSALNTITSVLGKAQAEATALDKNIQNVSSEVSKLQYTFQDLLDEMLSANEQITLAHQQNAVSHNELAVNLRSKLEYILQDDVARLLHNLEAFDSSLEWLSGRFGLLSEQEMSISERLRSFDITLKEFQLRAENLHKAQLQQAEAVEFQSKLQEKLQTSVQISQALLDKAAATTANLQAMIDETSARYKDSPVLRPLFSTYSSWTFYGLLLSLIASHNVKVALALLIISAFQFMATRIL
ncbi:nuclear membrane fusion protein Kar5 [Aspergillus bombycis]|uniref:Nuclear membrane fusion protein Kar5 n=1 Tax=Aspergillus bombycis TaxID=109264 RepID=A0A1F8A1J1_9EURO|nr:nuclear membrane fusion protein Kar5 [Aspergillus bombycis]OGM45195.1 nuclear membrane fusion protein Kar5 [Aspergillus bombycis]